ncbi:MAG: polysaccharide pyruvyl transferase family protein [Propionicimonas sp.]
MRVGFLGIQCDTANLGLAALAYSAVRIAHDLIPGEAEFVLFSINSDAELARMRTSLGITDKTIRAVPFWHKKPRAMVNSIREIAACDVVIDFTGGDSFSDIYGVKRLARKLFHKQLVLFTRTPLVLGPQTYGPIKHGISRPWFRHAVNRATLVFTRDDLSAEFLRGFTRREVLVSTDVAVTLPWDDESPLPPADGRTRIGLNVSGLLWNGGYTGDNQFGLTTDYRRYCHDVVDGLIAAGHQVHLVSHVLSRPWESGGEDDVRAAQQLHESHPEAILAPSFASPVEAKSYISKLDAFVGSRMHATIAAFTSGVPTVPGAYSRKFAGFFGNLGYPVVVDLTTASTADAVAMTLGHVADRERLRKLAEPANADAQQRIEVFTSRLGTLLRGARST